MKSFLLGTGNAHKAQEFKELFFQTLTINAAPRTLEVDETGSTFIENALIKAKAYFETYKVPALLYEKDFAIPYLRSLGVA